jgi:hypothetical protein
MLAQVLPQYDLRAGQIMPQFERVVEDFRACTAIHTPSLPSPILALENGGGKPDD